jgi:hypothetical protein
VPAFEPVSRPRTHGYVGVEPLEQCWISVCACGWTSDLVADEERALLAYGLHRAGAALTRRPDRGAGRR